MKIRQDSSFKGAFAESFSNALYHNQNSPKDRRQLICKEQFLTIPIVIYAKRDFYLLNALSENIEKFQESGLVGFWKSQDIDVRAMKAKSQDPPKVLVLSQLAGCFQFLLLGLATSFVVFVIEAFL